MYTYMLLFISSYWKISIKLCLKHLWQYVILWIGNLTGHSYVFKKISHNVILVIICGSVLQCNSNFHKISNIFQSAKHVVIHCLKKKKHENKNNKVCIMYITFSWIFLAHVTFLSPVLLLPHWNSVSSLVPWQVSMEILILYVWIFHHHINGRHYATKESSNYLLKAYWSTSLSVDKP